MRFPLVVLLSVALHGCSTSVLTGAVVAPTAKASALAVEATDEAAIGTERLVPVSGQTRADAGADEEPTGSLSCEELPDPKPQTCLTY